MNSGRTSDAWHTNRSARLRPSRVWLQGDRRQQVLQRLLQEGTRDGAPLQLHAPRMPRMTWPGLTGFRTAVVEMIGRGRTDKCCPSKSPVITDRPEVFKYDLPKSVVNRTLH